MEIKKIQLSKNDNIFMEKSNVVAIGFFDGLHKMHQKILKISLKWARKNNCLFSVVTFSEKIRNFLNKTKDHIFTRPQNYKKINELFGPDFIFEIQTNMKTISKTKEEFLHYLKYTLLVEKVVVGSDFRFGYKASGNVDDLKNFFGAKNVKIVKRNQKYSTSKLLKNL